MLNDLKKELSSALRDVESELEAMGGSVSDVMSVKSQVTARTAKSTASAQSAVSAKTAASAKAPASAKPSTPAVVPS